MTRHSFGYNRGKELGDTMEITTKKAIFLALSVGIMGTLLVAAMFGQAVQQDSVYKYLSVFSEVFSIVRTNYVDEVSSDALVDGAFQGVTQAVDEFSYYIPPAEMPAYKAFLDLGEAIDPGVVITKRFGYAFVLGVVIFTLLMTVPQVLTIRVGQQAAGVSVLSWSACLVSALLWFWFGIQKRDKNIYLPCVGWIALNSAVIAGAVVYG